MFETERHQRSCKGQTDQGSILVDFHKTRKHREVGGSDLYSNAS